MTPPDDFNFKLLDWAWAGLLALGSIVWKGQEAKMSKLDSEITRQRDVTAKIFDELTLMRRESAEGREKVMEGQIELLKAIHTGLAGKADK